MTKPKYLYKTEKNFNKYSFVSEGPKGNILKMIEYSETATENVFNLAFGDYDETTQSINDLSISNNGDSIKILATVASTIYAFLENHPNAYVLATGSTDVRTRLYRMGITNNLTAIDEDFLVYGLSKNGTWDEFEIGEDYDAFLITKK